MNIELFIFRPILAGLCTLKEAQEYYSIDDFADMNEALDLKDAIEEDHYRRAERNNVHKNH